jgi:hypothetical protein
VPKCEGTGYGEPRCLFCRSTPRVAQPNRDGSPFAFATEAGRHTRWRLRRIGEAGGLFAGQLSVEADALGESCSRRVGAGGGPMLRRRGLDGWILRGRPLSFERGVYATTTARLLTADGELFCFRCLVRQLHHPPLPVAEFTDAARASRAARRSAGSESGDRARADCRRQRARSRVPMRRRERGGRES